MHYLITVFHQTEMDLSVSSMEQPKNKAVLTL